MTIYTNATVADDRFRRNFGRPCGPFILLAIIGCAWLSVFVCAFGNRKWGPMEADCDRKAVANLHKIITKLKEMK